MDSFHKTKLLNSPTKYTKKSIKIKTKVKIDKNQKITNNGYFIPLTGRIKETIENKHINRQ